MPIPEKKDEFGEVINSKSQTENPEVNPFRISPGKPQTQDSNADKPFKKSGKDRAPEDRKE